MKKLTIDEILQKVEEESDTKKDSQAQTVKPESHPFIKKEIYEISDFSKYHDEEFIKNIYLGILHREPDEHGLHTHLSALRSGQVTKTDILCVIRYSKEGNINNVKILGLKKRCFIKKLYGIPAFGGLIKFAVAVLTLPKLINRINEYEAYTNAKINNLQHAEKVEVKQEDNISIEQLNQIKEDIFDFHKIAEDRIESEVEKFEGKIDVIYDDIKSFEEKIDSINNKITKYRLELDGKADVEELKVKADKLELEEKVDLAQIRDIRTNLDFIYNKKANFDQVEELRKWMQDKIDIADFEKELKKIWKNIKSHKMDILDNHRRMAMVIQEARKRFPKALEPSQLKNIAKEEQSLLDTLYIAFEDRYRGSKREIKEKLKVYLPYVKSAARITRDDSVLDLGCGRGEWLELLKENGCTPRGVEINQALYEELKKSAFDIVNQDALTYLESLDDNSITVISGFHIIEHIPFDELVRIFDECLRVLKVGGAVIFETPNPRNILVGSSDFYRDPTHLNPLHPETMEFTIEMRGFINTYAYFLESKEEQLFLEKAKDRKFHDINDYITVSRDYALIGYKA